MKKTGFEEHGWVEREDQHEISLGLKISSDLSLPYIPLNSKIGPSRKDGLRRRTITNLTVTATSHIFAIGA